MLVLSRKVGQELIIGDNIRIVVSRVAGNRVSLGIAAPESVHVVRAELQEIRDEFAEKKPLAVRGDLKARVASRLECAVPEPEEAALSFQLESTFDDSSALASHSVR